MTVIYSEKNQGKKKEFTAKYTINSKYSDGKSFSIGRNWTEDEAYNQAVKAAAALGTKYSVEPNVSSKEVLLAKYKQVVVSREVEKTQSVNSAPKATTKAPSNPLVEKFGNAGQWRALIKAAAKQHGAEKLLEVLKSGQEILEELVAAERKTKMITDSANRKMAEIVLEARDQGVNMPSPNTEIESYVQALIESKVRAGKRERVISKHALPTGETWDGIGHIPAEFSKYLVENPDVTIDDLKVA